MLVKLLAVCFLVLCLGAATSVVLKGQDVLSAFGDRLDGTSRDEVSDAKRKLCSTLDDDTRLDLIGRPTPVKLLNVEGALDPYTCRWAPEDYKETVAFVEVVSAPANKWAKFVRPTLARQGAIDPALKKRLLEIIEGPKVTRAEGCRFARAVFEAGGAPRGAERTVTRSGPIEVPPSMTAHSCVDGTYTAVLVKASGLLPSDALGTKLAASLRVVEQKLS